MQVNAVGRLSDADAHALLDSTLGTSLVGGLADLDLSVGAISATADQANGENGKQTGDYNIASLTLNLKSPLLAGMYHKPWVQGPASAMGTQCGPGVSCAIPDRLTTAGVSQTVESCWCARGCCIYATLCIDLLYMGSNAASISLRRSTTTRATLDAEDDVVSAIA